ncbi:DUF2931 family protein [Pseudomonas benzenivorans]|uniref:DUF2931 family protein n=1 Tax=Pseudomonas benzenivorans TaxID=556533 RepID=A0ABZ0PXE2_9PSED|nr:DUF2931 family protein [Pseudomonas benzenivorans]WPC05863.1 DUF2931 family protein [Pseudomonas benzenivorans]
MKHFLLILFALFPLLASAKPATDLVGRYVLQGVRETGSTLLLRADGSFEATYAFGNLDGHIKGRWQRTENTVTLASDGHSDVAELFKDVPLAVGEHCLIRDMGDYKACYLRQPRLPYKAWRLGFFAPDYMDVWLETADVTDVRGITSIGAVQGTVSIRQPENGSGKPAGWSKRFGWGAGHYLSGLDLPESIFIRWQSLAEPQTYRATLTIPADTRAIMLRQEPAKCGASGRTSDYRLAIVIGLAPGGIAKAWVMGACLPPIEISRIQAKIEPKGPYQGLSEGRHRPLKPAAKAYIEQHGIPYGSW